MEFFTQKKKSKEFIQNKNVCKKKELQRRDNIDQHL